MRSGQAEAQLGRGQCPPCLHGPSSKDELVALTLHAAKRGAFGAPGLPLLLGNLLRQLERAPMQYQPWAAAGTQALVGEGRAGGVSLCSSAPSCAGVGAGLRAGHCALCCKGPSYGWYCRGQEVTNKDTSEMVARGWVVREQQGAERSPAGGARPGT